MCEYNGYTKEQYEHMHNLFPRQFLPTNRNNISNHVVGCNYCGKKQIIVHCGTNGDHSFELATFRSKIISDCVAAVESLPGRVEPISGQNFTYVQRGEAIDAIRALEI